MRPCRRLSNRGGALFSLIAAALRPRPAIRLQRTANKGLLLPSPTPIPRTGWPVHKHPGARLGPVLDHKPVGTLRLFHGKLVRVSVPFPEDDGIDTIVRSLATQFLLTTGLSIRMWLELVAPAGLSEDVSQRPLPCAPRPTDAGAAPAPSGTQLRGRSQRPESPCGKHPPTRFRDGSNFQRSTAFLD